MKRFVLSRMVFQMNSVLFKFMLRRILLLQRSIFSFNLRCAICAISNFSGFWCQKLTNFHTLNANNFFFSKEICFHLKSWRKYRWIDGALFNFNWKRCKMKQFDWIWTNLFQIVRKSLAKNHPNANLFLRCKTQHFQIYCFDLLF